MKLIDFAPSDLAKFCPPEFNVKNGCNTVRFGTLYDFRAEEDEKLRDEGEGTFSYSISFPELTKVSQEWINAFGFEGEGHFYIGELELRFGEPYVKDMVLTGSSHNCWIYCVSKSTESAGNITDTHQDKWLIPADKIKNLANYFASLLFSEITIADLPVEIIEKYSIHEIQRQLSLNVELREVEYGERSVLITSEEELPISEVSYLKDSITFLKPKIFEKEQEVRMAFWLMFGEQKISIINKPKIVSLRPIDKIL